MLYFLLAKRRGRNSDLQKIIYKILECFEFLCALQSQRATDLLMKPPFRPVLTASSLLPKPPDHSATPPLKHPFQRGSGVSVKRLKKYGGTTTIGLMSLLLVIGLLNSMKLYCLFSAIVMSDV